MFAKKIATKRCRKKYNVTFWDIYFNKYDKHKIFSFTGWYIHTSIHSHTPNHLFVCSQHSCVYMYRTLADTSDFFFTHNYDNLTTRNSFLFQSAQLDVFSMQTKLYFHCQWIGWERDSLYSQLESGFWWYKRKIIKFCQNANNLCEYWR